MLKMSAIFDCGGFGFHFPLSLNGQNLVYHLNKALRGVNQNPINRLAVESAEKGFFAGKEGSAHTRRHFSDRESAA